MADRLKKNADILQAVQDSAKQIQTEDGQVTLSTGVVLELVPVPKLFLRRLWVQYEEKKPKVPIYFNPEKDREEENPADPDYIASVQTHDTDFMFTIIDFGIMFGTALKKKPKHMEGPEDGDWVAEQEYLGVPVPKESRLRYLAWVTLVAAPDDDDQRKLSEAVLSLLGTPEAAVEAEMTGFPGDQGRSPDTESAPALPSSDGH